MVQRNPLSFWPRFARDVRARLERGAVEYGNRSFTRAPADLLGEIRQELLDVCAWSFILAERIEALRVAAARSGRRLAGAGLRSTETTCRKSKVAKPRSPRAFLGRRGHSCG